ncbi:MAG: AIR synthase-related protein [Actinomycetota bacterium]|nr:AIR synthase-related protein [Actinomycetota bacterium]
MGDSYEAAGVNYEVLDAAKRAAIEAAVATGPLLATHGAAALEASRGEPAFVFQMEGRYFAFVLECLGTKSIVARRFLEDSGEDRFAEVAYDTVAAIVNDLCCPGALPLVVNAYFATGSDAFFADGDRLSSLVAGWKRACEDAGATWGGGESPTLSGLVGERDVELAGSAVGYVPDGRVPLLGGELGAGDEIVLVASSGLHANGASLVRAIADRLPDGLLTPLDERRSFGDAALDASVIYAPLVKGLYDAAIQPTYMTHITGHGLRKLMRPARDLTYRLERLAEVPPVLEFIASRAGMDDREAYGTLNMGAGFAVYCRAGEGDAVCRVAERVGMDALVAGVVEEGPRRVVLEPVDVTYDAADLSLR